MRGERARMSGLRSGSSTEFVSRQSGEHTELMRCSPHQIVSLTVQQRATATASVRLPWTMMRRRHRCHLAFLRLAWGRLPSGFCFARSAAGGFQFGCWAGNGLFAMPVEKY